MVGRVRGQLRPAEYVNNPFVIAQNYKPVYCPSRPGFGGRRRIGPEDSLKRAYSIAVG